MFDLIKELGYMLFPKSCAVCGIPVNRNDDLCNVCRDTLMPITEKTCQHCGLPKKDCECKKYAYHFRGASSPFINEGAAQKGIYGFKFAKNYYAAEYFAGKMAEKLSSDFPEVKFDCVTSVPCHWTKRIARWYDHAAILGREVARRYNIPFKRLIVKKRRNKIQHKLSVEDRFANVKRAYVAKKNHYTNVLLIDDIKTTGATLDECSRQLMLAGCRNVYVATAVIGACKSDKG